MLVLGGRPWDRAIDAAVHVTEDPLRFLAVLITHLGDWQTLIGLTLLGTLWLLFRREWKLALLLAAGTMIGRGLVGVLKVLVGRARPEDGDLLVYVHGLSFPSGHATNSMMVYGSLAVLLGFASPQRRAYLTAAVLLSLLIGTSRVLLSVHWPSDVVGGWALGLFWVLLTALIAQTLKRNSRTSPSLTT